MGKSTDEANMIILLLTPLPCRVDGAAEGKIFGNADLSPAKKGLWRGQQIDLRRYFLCPNLSQPERGQ